MLAAVTKRVIASKVLARVPRRNNSSQAVTGVSEKAAGVADKALKAASISAVAAKLAWEKEVGLFVDLREGANGIQIEGFERIPASQLAKQLAKLEEAAKTANTKDIYFLDATGFNSGVAVNMLTEFAQFNGYNARAIQGGIGEWMEDNGPWEPTNPDVQAWIKKTQAEAAAETVNEQYLTQISAELGLGASTHEMLTLPEGTNEVQEHIFDPAADKSFDTAAFKAFTQKYKL